MLRLERMWVWGIPAAGGLAGSQPKQSIGSKHCRCTEVAQGWPAGKEGPPRHPQPQERCHLHHLPLTLLLLLQGGHCDPLQPPLGTGHRSGRAQPHRVTHNPVQVHTTSCGDSQPHTDVHNPMQAYTILNEHAKPFMGLHNPTQGCAQLNMSAHNHPRECTLYVPPEAHSDLQRPRQPCTSMHNPASVHVQPTQVCTAPYPFAKILQAHIPTRAHTTWYRCEWPHTGTHNSKCTRTTPKGHAEPQIGTHNLSWVHLLPINMHNPARARTALHGRTTRGGDPDSGGEHRPPEGPPRPRQGHSPARLCCVPQAGGSCAT